MLSIFKHAVHDNANIIIPAFAIERSQEIIYEINLMVENGLLEEVPVFLDSPMAKRATEVFIKYEKYYDTDARRLLEKGDDPFDFVGFEMTRNVEDSKALASKQGVIIMAGSGMCTGGRVLHHLRNNLSDPRNHVMFVGYQVGGTLGRRLVEGDDKVRIFGKEVKVKAQVHTVGGLSAHADQRDLKYWLRGFGNTPEKVFIVHGDESVMYEFEDVLNEDLGLETHIPKRREVVELE
jgi:metallo-beta-lactamase family protein